MSHPHEPGQFGSPPNGSQPPYGTGPQQPPTEPYGWQPGFPIEPVPPANSNKAVLVAIGLVVALGVGLGAFFLLTKKDTTPAAAPPATSSAKSVTSPPKATTTTTKPKKTDRIATAGVGDCVKVNDDSAEDADVAPLDCAKPEAVFKIAKKLASGAETCPADSDYLEYEETGRLGPGFSLCLMLNAKTGDCFTDLDEADQAKKVACADPAVKFEVLEIVDGGTGPEDCASSKVDDGFIYTEPKMVICGKSRK